MYKQSVRLRKRAPHIKKQRKSVRKTPAKVKQRKSVRKTPAKVKQRKSVRKTPAKVKQRKSVRKTPAKVKQRKSVRKTPAKVKQRKSVRKTPAKVKQRKSVRKTPAKVKQRKSVRKTPAKVKQRKSVRKTPAKVKQRKSVRLPLPHGSIESINFKNIHQVDIKSYGRSCIQISTLNNDQYRLKEFLNRFSEYYSYFCPKSVESIKPESSLHDGKLQMGNAFVDIRPKKHKLPDEFKKIVKNIREDKSFYNISDVTGIDSIIYSLFTGISTNIPNYDINFEYVNGKIHEIQYGYKQDPKTITFYGKRMIYNLGGEIKVDERNIRHAMLLIQEADGQIYLFNPNGFKCMWTELILQYKDKFIDLFENKGNGVYI